MFFPLFQDAEPQAKNPSQHLKIPDEKIDGCAIAVATELVMVSEEIWHEADIKIE